MKEQSHLDVRVFGGSNELQDYVLQVFEERGTSRVREFVQALSPARLSSVELQNLRDVERLARSFLFEKITDLGVPESELPVFLEVQYAQESSRDKEKKDSRGFYNILNNTVVAPPADKFQDSFDDYSIIVHELSHNSVKQELRLYLSSSIEGKDSAAFATGIGIVGGQVGLAKGIEEGMTIFDEVNFF